MLRVIDMAGTEDVFSGLMAKARPGNKVVLPGEFSSKVSGSSAYDKARKAYAETGAIAAADIQQIGKSLDGNYIAFTKYVFSQVKLRDEKKTEKSGRVVTYVNQKWTRLTGEAVFTVYDLKTGGVVFDSKHHAGSIESDYVSALPQFEERDRIDYPSIKPKKIAKDFYYGIVKNFPGGK